MVELHSRTVDKNNFFILRGTYGLQKLSLTYITNIRGPKSRTLYHQICKWFRPHVSSKYHVTVEVYILLKPVIPPSVGSPVLKFTI